MRYGAPAEVEGEEAWRSAEEVNRRLFSLAPAVRLFVASFVVHETAAESKAGDFACWRGLARAAAAGLSEESDAAGALFVFLDVRGSRPVMEAVRDAMMDELNKLPEARLRIARRCPRVTLVQTPHDSLPQEAQLSRPLDADVVEELRQHISLPAWPQPSPVPDTTPHIATLFRCAYEERDARLEPKRLRNARKAARLAAEPPQHSVSPAYLRRIGALCHTED